MISLHLHLNKKERSFLVAENWQEVSAMQLHNIVRILITERKPQAKKLKLLACLLKYSLNKLINHSEATLEKLLPLVDWIEETEYDVCIQPIPAIRAGMAMKFYGPTDFLQNLLFAEFDFAERKLYEWHQNTENYEALYQFVAIIYRPRRKDYDLKLNPNGDVREIFNSNLTALYAQKLMRNVDVVTCIAITLWYKACRKFITEQFPAVFATPSTDKSEISNCPAYFGLMRAIAEKGTFGTFDNVEQLSIYTALLELETAISQQEQQKEE